VAGSENVLNNFRAYVGRTKATLHALGDHYAQKMEGEAKPAAPWTDRTGDARRGLFGSVEERDSQLLIRLSGSERHNVYLELANQGKYAVIGPTVKRNAPDFIRDAERVIKG